MKIYFERKKRIAMGNDITDINDGLTVEERNRVMDYVYPLMHLIYADKTQSYKSRLTHDSRFFELLMMLDQPQAIAKKFNISTENKLKLTAIKELYAAAIRTNYGEDGGPLPISENREWYRQVIMKEYNQEITHIVLLDDPVCQASPITTSPTELELLFSQTHFQSLPNQSREETKKYLKEEITRLYNDPLTHHVIAALIYAMKNNQSYSRLVFSNSPAVSNTSIAYYVSRDKVIFCPLPYRLEISKKAKNRQTGLGHTLIHESLHFIFDTLYQNHSVPFKKDDKKKELQLQEALNDMGTRMPNVALETLNEYQVFNIMSEVAHYQPDKNCNIQYVESIVRPLECLASGYALDAVNKITPELWSFYQAHCLPDIQTYVETERRKALEDATIQPLKTPIAFKLPNDSTDHSAAKNDKERFEQLFVAMQSFMPNACEHATVVIDDFIKRCQHDIQDKRIIQLWEKWPQSGSELDKEFLRAMTYLFHTLLQQPVLSTDKARAKQVICHQLITLLCALVDLGQQEYMQHNELLSEALRCGAALLLEPGDKDVEDVSWDNYYQQINVLEQLAKKLPGHASSKLFAVSLALTLIGCVAIISFALLTSIPVFTASLLMVLHQTGLYSAAAAIGGAGGAVAGVKLVGTGVGAVSALIGLGLFASNEPQGVAKSIHAMVQTATLSL